MTTVELYCQGASVRQRVQGMITAGMAGIPVSVHCDEAWDGLIKTLVAMTAYKKEVVPIVEDHAVVPWEPLVEGMHLYLGLEGRDASGNVVMPTAWADCGKVWPSAEHSHDALRPTPTEVEQLLMHAGEAVQRAREVWDASAAGVFLEQVRMLQKEGADQYGLIDALAQEYLSEMQNRYHELGQLLPADTAALLERLERQREDVKWVNAPAFLDSGELSRLLAGFREDVQGFTLFYRDPTDRYGITFPVDAAALEGVNTVSFDYAGEGVGIRAGIYSTTNGSAPSVAVSDEFIRTDAAGSGTITVNHALAQQETASGKRLMLLFWNNIKTGLTGDFSLRVANLRTDAELPLKALLLHLQTRQEEIQSQLDRAEASANAKLAPETAFASIAVHSRVLASLKNTGQLGTAGVFERQEDGSIRITGAPGTVSCGLRTVDVQPAAQRARVLLDLTACTGGVFQVEAIGHRVSNGKAVSTALGEVSGPGEYRFEMDLAYLAVYADFAPPFYISVTQNRVQAQTGAAEAVISKLEVLDCPYPFEEGTPLGTLLTRLDAEQQRTSAEMELMKAPQESVRLRDESGMVQTVRVADGQVLIKGVPCRNLLFIGNSLLMGMEKYSPEPFGMAASSPSEDYYALVMAKIRERTSDAAAQRLSGNGFEAATASNRQKETFYTQLDAKLSPEVDTVIIQLGDNVNTPERLAAFRSNARELIRRIRSRTSDTVRIFWAASWFNAAEVRPVVLDACIQEGAVFVDISDIWKTAHVGDTITLSDGSTHTIESKGEADHPGSEGMRIIADRLLAAMVSGADGFNPRAEIAKKADRAFTYTKAEVDARLRDAVSGDYSDMQRSVRAMERRLGALWKLSQGQLYDFEHAQEAGTNAPPSGAAYMRPEKVFGSSKQNITHGYQLLPREVTFSRSSTTEEWDGNTFRAAVKTAGTYRYSQIELNDFLVPGETYTLRVGDITQGGTADACVSIMSSDNITYVRCYANSSETFSAREGSKLRAPVSTSIPAEVGMEIVARDLMIEKGSAAHDWEPYTGGLPSPSVEYPQEIGSVESICIRHADSQGNTVAQRTIIPPRPLNAVGEYRDVCDVENGVWIFNIRKYTFDGSTTVYKWPNSEGCTAYFFKVDDGALGSNSEIKSNYFYYNGNVYSTVNKMGCVNNSAYGQIGFGTHYANTEDFQAWLTQRNAEGNPLCAIVPFVQSSEPIESEDLEFLRALADIPTSDTLTVTDQDGREVPWLNEYIINLKDVMQ